MQKICYRGGDPNEMRRITLNINFKSDGSLLVTDNQFILRTQISGPTNKVLIFENGFNTKRFGGPLYTWSPGYAGKFIKEVSLKEFIQIYFEEAKTSKRSLERRS